MVLMVATILYVILGITVCCLFSHVGEEYNEYEFKNRKEIRFRR